MNLVALIIQLVSGAIGGNIAGSALKQYALGTVGNSIAGIIGGGIGGQLLTMILGGGGAAAAAGNLDVASILTQVVGGGVGGGILMVIVGMIRQAMSGQSAGS